MEKIENKVKKTVKAEPIDLSKVEMDLATIIEILGVNPRDVMYLKMKFADIKQIQSKWAELFTQHDIMFNTSKKAK